MPADPVVLIIDDHADSLRLSRLILGYQGFDVHEATHAVDGIRLALDLAGRGGLQAIVLDITLPYIDGLTAVRVLRGLPELNDVVLIALTANVAADIEQQALQAGFDYYFSKPITSHFASQVRGCIQQGRVSGADAGLNTTPADQ